MNIRFMTKAADILLKFNYRSTTLATNISLDNKATLKDSATPNVFFLNFVFVFVYSVFKARAALSSLDKQLSTEEFLFLSHGETISSREIVYQRQALN